MKQVETSVSIFSAMKKALKRFITVYVVFVAIFVVAKLLFLLIYSPSDVSAADWLDVVLHGLPIDFCVAGYLSVVPGLLQIVRLWTSGRWPALTLKIYFGIVGAALSAIFILDTSLYGYWNFKLDTTPLFYFASSPSAALASATGWQLAAAVLAFVAVGTAISLLLVIAGVRKVTTAHRPWKATLAMAVAVGLLFIPIRGGFTVSTMNVSRAYFSHDRFLNHAAVNPSFSLLYSATHSNGYASQYRFMPDDEVSRYLPVQPTAGTDSAHASILNTERPDIYLVILESFSAHLMPSLNGDSIAMRLDSIANSGIIFSNFYASSFRTDRALPAILNGLPGQPSTSVLKFVDKVEKLPSLARELGRAGYETSYYYGGDINFTNMKALLVGGGFRNIISDADFPISDKTGKWGACDGKLVEKVLQDVVATQPGRSPQFRVVQTSSSHEPFDVPYAGKRFAGDPRLNAFAYADSCLGALVDGISQSPRGDRALIVIVLDHQGAWPDEFESLPSRHHIPLVFAGKALAVGGVRDSTLGCQPDIATTVLKQLGIPADDFLYGVDLFSQAQPHTAFMSRPGEVAFISGAGDTVVFNPDAEDVIAGNDTERAPLLQAKAVLQNLYTNLSNL